MSQIAFIAEFSLTCSNQLDNLPLYAEIGNNRLSPVVRIGDKYQVSKENCRQLKLFQVITLQVSWSEETKKAKSGNHEVKLYDEESYSIYKKAQRSGENTQNVKPLASLFGKLQTKLK